MIDLAACYQRPDLEAVTVRAKALADGCRSASTAEDAIAAIRAWNQLRGTVDTQLNIAGIRYHQDTRDVDAQAEQAFWDESAPTLRELDVLYANTLLTSPHRDAIEGAFGPQLLRLKECASQTFSPAIADAIAAEARLTSRYTALLARPEAVFRGERMSLSALATHFVSADRATRLEAQRALDGFLAPHSDALDAIFGELVATRDGMGRALGFDGFTPLGYSLMNRSAYGPDEVATFRDTIRDEIVPIATELHAEQRETLGVDALLYHDEPVWDRRGNPRPEGDSAFIMAQARHMYRELGEEFGVFMDLLIDKGLLDVDARDGKAGGGFCTQLIDLGLPFVFANFNGSDADLLVITHECGHAFQCWSSRAQRPRVEYGFPTYEAAEVHSMSMEFLTYPWMGRFFGDDAERYRQIHLRRAIAMLPYTAAVDHFQHDVYANPGMTPAQRNQRWRDLEQIYLPHRDYGAELPALASGRVWQRQLHIFSSPFYYIDYALARVCSMQFWHRAETDRDQALADYLAICRVGGSQSFGELLKTGRLRSPFDPACLREVAQHVRQAIRPL